MILLRDLLKESYPKKLIVYHGTGKRFKQFNLKKTTQGIIWFTSDKNKILKGEVGAESSGYILTCEVTINNPAGWNEYDKYLLFQLKSMGYDGVILPIGDKDNFDCFVFSPDQVKILKAEKTEDLLKEEEDYRGSHTAPDKSNGAPLHDLTKIYPDDIYGPNAARYYGDLGGDLNDRASAILMQSARNKPDMKIRIYRAVPNLNKETENKIKKFKYVIDYVNQFGFAPMEDKAPKGLYSDLGFTYGDVNYDKVQFVTKVLQKIEELEKSKSQSKLEINPGDWVTLNKNYAKQHGESTLLGNYKVLSKVVLAKHLFTDANSIHEFGYDPM